MPLQRHSASGGAALLLLQVYGTVLWWAQARVLEHRMAAPMRKLTNGSIERSEWCGQLGHFPAREFYQRQLLTDVRGTAICTFDKHRVLCCYKR